MNLCYLPALILILGCITVPLLNAFKLSMYSWNGYSQTKRWLGMDNYINMFHDRFFWIAFKNTWFYGFGCALIQNVLGLSIALLVSSKMKGRVLVRVIVYLPIMISGILMGYILRYFVQHDGGVFNEIIGWFGAAPVNWTAVPMRGVAIIVFAHGIQHSGASMILYLAGLQNIPKMYYESAEIDGASGWKKFIKVTLPLLMPVTSTAVVMNLIGNLKLNDVIMSMTGGGPGMKTNSLSSYVNYMYFSHEKAGYSAAVGMFMFLFILILSLIANRFFRKREVEY